MFWGWCTGDCSAMFQARGGLAGQPLLWLRILGSRWCCPRGLHSVIWRLLAGGSLAFRIVPLLLPGSQIAVWHFRDLLFALFYFAIPIPGVIQCYHLFWYVSDDYELTSWSPTVLFLGCVLFCFWFVCVCVFVLLLPCVSCLVSCPSRSQLNGLCIDPTQFYFWCTLLILWCCHCINSRNWNLQLAFRLA